MKGIKITDRPAVITIDDLNIKKSECFYNSYQVAKKHSEVEIVEGVLVAVEVNNTAIALCHFWNKLGDIYFDVTYEKVWNGEDEMEQTKEFRYLAIHTYDTSDFPNKTNIKFTPETINTANEMNAALTKE